MMPLTRKRMVEYGIAILIGVAVVGAIVLYAEIGPFAWMPSIRWWGLAASTGVLFWTTVTQYRRHWRQRSFWLTMTWLTALHLAAWSVVLAKVSVWGLLWFLPPLLVEAALLVLVLPKLGYDH